MKAVLISTYGVLLATMLALPRATTAEPQAGEKYPALKDAVVMIIRHAEKPEEGLELSPAGVKRAEAYATFFKEFKVDSEVLKPDYIFATADSKGSHRPRLTVEPLGQALGLKVDARFKNKQVADVAREIQFAPHGRHILICWHHGEIPELVKTLGANPATLLPEGKWPADEFSWVLVLHYDHEGRLMPGNTKRVSEKLMPGDG